MTSSSTPAVIQYSPVLAVSRKTVILSALLLVPPGVISRHWVLPPVAELGSYQTCTALRPEPGPDTPPPPEERTQGATPAVPV